MEVILSWFDQGQNVTWAELKGSYSGRCFRMDEPNNPKNAFLSYMSVPKSDGPGFPHGLPLLFHVYTSLYENFDEASEARIQKQKSQVRDYWYQLYGTPSEVPTVNQPYGFEPDSRVPFRLTAKVEFKKYGTYFVSRNTATATGRIVGNRWLQPGEIFTACYFFKKLGE